MTEMWKKATDNPLPFLYLPIMRTFIRKIEIRLFDKLKEGIFLLSYLEDAYNCAEKF